jgi:alpha-tubulin suppressor-like RCC1 family protein
VVTWTSTNPAVASIGSATGVVTAHSRGTTTIIATSEAATAQRPVNGVLGFAQLSGASSHTCGRTTTSEIYCWGSNGSGQLGDGTQTNRLLATRIASGDLFKNLTTSRVGWHTCAISTADKLFCWGLNDFGQLGLGPTQQGFETQPRAVAPQLNVAEVALGGLFTCVRTTGNATSCAGSNQFGQLGDGSQHVLGRADLAPISGNHQFVGLTAGWAFICGRKPNAPGPVSNTYCWGDNSRGSLGRGDLANSLVPVAISGTLQFDQIVAGFRHACGRAGTTVYCWGANESGQLGDGTQTDRLVPVPVSGGHAFTLIAAGGNHTCGLVSATVMYCWGANNDGQLGDRTTQQRSVPTFVGGSTTDLAPGESHTCLLVGMVAWCSGRNNDGQLGDGTTTTRVGSVFVR